MRDPNQVVPDLYQLPVGGASAFLAVGERVTVIDAGRNGSGSRIIQCLGWLGRSAKEIDYIVSTHYHLDHIGGVAHLQERSGAQVVAHQSEVPFLERDRPLPSPFQSRFLSFLMAPSLRLSRPPHFWVDLSLGDSDRLDILGCMEVIHTPGHTPGSISLYFRQAGTLIVGDGLEFRGGKLGLPSRIFTSDMAQAEESIRRLARLDFDTLCFSHYPPLKKGASPALRRFSEALD